MRTMATASAAAFLIIAFPLDAFSQENPLEQSIETQGTMEKQPTGQEKMMETGAKEEKAKMVVSAEDKKKWIGLQVYSSDNKEIGKVTEVLTTDDSSLREIRIETGGILGFFTTTLVVKPDQFEKQENKIALKLTEQETERLPQPNT